MACPRSNSRVESKFEHRSSDFHAHVLGPEWEITKALSSPNREDSML